jgi:hypothetical protein
MNFKKYYLKETYYKGAKVLDTFDEEQYIEIYKNPYNYDIEQILKEIKNNIYKSWGAIRSFSDLDGNLYVWNGWITHSRILISNVLGVAEKLDCSLNFEKINNIWYVQRDSYFDFNKLPYKDNFNANKINKENKQILIQHIKDAFGENIVFEKSAKDILFA